MRNKIISLICIAAIPMFRDSGKPVPRLSVDGLEAKSVCAAQIFLKHFYYALFNKLLYSGGNIIAYFCKDMTGFFNIKFIVFTLLCCLITGTLQAQKLHLSEKEDFNFRTDDFSVVGKMKQSVVVFRQRGKEPEIIFYNTSMVKEKSMKLDMIPENFSGIHVFCSPNSLLVFYETRDNKKQQVYAIRLLENNTWTTPVLLDTRPSAIGKDRSTYYFAESEDKTKILFYTAFFDAGENTLQVVVMDNQLNIQKQTRQLFRENVFYFSDKAAVSNKGVPYILATDKPNNRGNVEELKLLTIVSLSQEITVYPLNLQKYALSDWQVKVDNKNTNVYIAAFFADGRYNNSRGIYFSVFDEEKQAETTSHFLPVALQIVSSKTDLKDMKIRNFYIKNDGGIEIAAEKTYQNTRSLNSISPIVASSFMTTAENARTVTEFSYDEIYIFNLKTDGSLLWSQTILKEQLSTDDGGVFSSFSTHQYPIGNAYIFNDLSTRSSRLLICYVSASGELNMKELQTSEQMDEWDPMPRSGKQISRSEMVIPCVMKNQLSFLKITY